MYCILVTGIPASGKSTIAKYLSEYLRLPLISKDDMKELMYDAVGFRSREEKVGLGIASMNIMYYMAEQLMKCGSPFILENNFENISRDGLAVILEKYSYQAITVTLTGDYVRYGPHMILDTTDFARVDKDKLVRQLIEFIQAIDGHSKHI